MTSIKAKHAAGESVQIPLLKAGQNLELRFDIPEYPGTPRRNEWPNGEKQK
jgi:hypothetical protein